MPQRRPTHPIKELEALLREAESKGWRVVRSKYYKMYCPCGRHKKIVHLSPSNRRYESECRKQLKRTTCWDDDEQDSSGEG